MQGQIQLAISCKSMGVYRHRMTRIGRAIEDLHNRTREQLENCTQYLIVYLPFLHPMISQLKLLKFVQNIIFLFLLENDLFCCKAPLSRFNPSHKYSIINSTTQRTNCSMDSFHFKESHFRISFTGSNVRIYSSIALI